MVGKPGFEPGTSCMSSKHSNHLSYSPADGGGTQIRTGDRGFADLGLTAWLCRQYWSGRRDLNPRPPPWQGGVLPLNYFRASPGAESRNRTSDTGIFSPLLYRLSYLGKVAEPTGLEPAISGLTGRCVNQLHHGSTWWAKQDLNL